MVEKEEEKLLRYAVIIIIIIFTFIAVSVISMIDFSEKESNINESKLDIARAESVKKQNIIKDTSGIEDENENSNQQYTEKTTEDADELFSKITEIENRKPIKEEMLKEILSEFKLGGDFRYSVDKEGFINTISARIDCENEEQIEMITRKFEGTIYYESINVIGKSIYISY